MSRNVFGWLAMVGIVAGFGMARVAEASDCATINGAACDDPGSAVCSYTGGQVVCGGSSSADTYSFAVFGSNPLVYGTYNGTEYCCDNTTNSDWSITSAVPVDVDSGGGGDTICLIDAPFNGYCANEYTGVQYWGEAADIDSGIEDDIIVTCTDGYHDDYVVAGSGDDTVYTFAGDDTVYGYANDDEIHAGDGADTVDGGYDNDTIHGDSHSDTITGGATGQDTLYGNLGADILDGEGDADTIAGGGNGDDVVGGEGADDLSGGSGGDCICSGDNAGSNQDSAIDTIDGNEDYDYCYYNVNDASYIDTATNCEAGDDEASTCLCTGW